MPEKEKRIAQALADAYNAVPEAKKEYLIGFAEGVAAMLEHSRATNQQAKELREEAQAG